LEVEKGKIMHSFIRRVVPAVALLAIAGCGNSGGRGEPIGENAPSSSQSAAAPSGEKLTIALLPKQKGSQYFESCNDGAQAAAKELGDVEVVYDGPTDGNATKASDMIKKWTLKKVDAICVSPNAPDVVAPAMKEAKAKGIKVLTWDADGDKSTRDWFVNQATAEQIGYALVDTMNQDIGAAGGEVAIISADATAANQNEWMKYMKERLKKYPKLQLKATKFAGEDQKLAFTIAQDLMKAYPNLKGIWGISSQAFPAAADAVKQAGNSGKIMVTGLSTPNAMKEHVKNGTVKSVVLWNTNDLGYLTILAARAAVKGELKAGDKTFKAGKLGDKKIAGDNILLGDILVFNKSNIEKFDF
jgi:rhamnose transport system substrate-binding protein